MMPRLTLAQLMSPDVAQLLQNELNDDDEGECASLSIRPPGYLILKFWNERDPDDAFDCGALTMLGAWDRIKSQSKPGPSTV